RLRALREMELFEQAGAVFVGAPALGGVAHDAHQAAVVQSGERKILREGRSVAPAADGLAAPEFAVVQARQDRLFEAALLVGFVEPLPAFADQRLGAVVAMEGRMA